MNPAPHLGNPTTSVVGGRQNGWPWMRAAARQHSNRVWRACSQHGRAEVTGTLAGTPRRVLRVGWNWGFLEGTGSPKNDPECARIFGLDPR